MLALCTASAVAQGPNGSGTYYRNADGQKGKALKTALFNIIKNPSVTTYAGLKDAYKKTDVREDGYLRDWYSNVTKFEPGSAFGNYKKEGDAYNREHTVPQSWFGEASPMKSDIVHVVPVDGYINNMRSDYPFGKVNKSASNTKSSINNYSYCGPSQTPGYTGTVFEPNDDVKGDIARIYFYMATCYEDRITTWTKGTGAKVIADDRETPFLSWVMDLLMEWSALDPVDEVETARNNAVYSVQKNRNPFVDYPGLENYIWGEVRVYYARSALGLLGRHHYLLMNINHGQWEYDHLPSLRQAADAMVRRGCYKAYTLDGGQTATTVFHYELINPVQFGWEKEISDIIYFASARDARRIELPPE